MLRNITLRFLNFTYTIRKSRPAHILFLEVVLGFILTLVSLVLFIKIRDEVLEKSLSNFDAIISQFLYGMRSPLLNKIMIYITYIGGRFFFIFAILAAILFTIRHHRREAVLFGFILTMTVLLNLFLKSVTARQRPQYFPLVTATDYSFPSGHSMNSMVFFATTSYFTYHFTKRKRVAVAVAGISVVLILLIGISRVYLGVHYPTDVLGGYALGFSWFVGVLLVEKTLKFYKIFHEAEPT